MVKEVYDGTRKPGDISAEDVQRTYDELNKGAGSGWGKGWDEGVIGDSPGNERIRLMKQNIYKFSAAKSHTQLMELNALLYDGDRLKSYEEFKAAADKLGVEYNENWLEAEYRTARQSGHMAAKWESIEANKKLFPNLKYKTQEDNRVRKDHEALNGIIAPIDSPFWDKYFPPNGWRCRCDAVQTAEPASTDIPDTLPEVKPEFEINVGKGGKIYNEDSKTGHRFFALAKKDPNWPKRFELSKLEAGYEKVVTKKGNKVIVNIYADENDLEKNMELTETIKEVLNEDYKIRPHINLDKFKNPELLDLNNIKGDRISPKWKNVKTATDNAFKDKLRDGQLSNEKNCFIAIEINFEPTSEKIKDFSKQSWSKFKHYESLDYVMYYKDGKVVKIERNIINEGFEYYASLVESLF